MIKPSQCFSTTNNLSNGLTVYVAFAGALTVCAMFVLVPSHAALAGLPLVAGLSVLSAIDIRSHLLPDALTLPLLLLGLAVSVLGYGPSPMSSAAGAALGWGGFAAIAYFYRILRGFDGLGLGDAKLLGALGAWTGAFALPAIVLLAASLGLLYYGALRIRGLRIERHKVIPFGPFLALAGGCAFIVTNMEFDAHHAIHIVM